MKNVINTLMGVVMAVAIIAPSLAAAQSPALVASIDSPATGSTFDVNETISFTGSATGGSGVESNYDYNWTWGDGTQDAGQNETHSYTASGTKTVTYRVTDFATGQTDTDTISVTIGEADEEDLLITNVRVTDITQSSAIVRWTTNRPATSRVIYDTASRRAENGDTIGSAPNYGYSNSTSRDDNKVTEHAVTLTGLSANTQYFFRVLSAE
ncbi:MAG: hypothetical protein A2589_02165 [Candidatus Vogelbacteria bacterium RIFOXYD1_FULL_46_19]|uniref:PKD domain-containing protein n=1 Tax=Candidatus Vogelbacteria bacterium RIFOXYD1_FULL_46_19 TaxID=1802439 RepID=A0A1G2QG91_9BACT|nr:MAG: hypothetical protein A2589_02165 [Candidatus Vogelbacteria bacterium RIFOXYD1_FULL_46_19]